MRIFFISLLSLFVSCTQKDENIKSENAEISEEQSLKSLLSSHPDSFALVQNLTNYYIQKGNHDAALSILNSSLQKDSLNPFLLDMQGYVYAQKGDTLNSIKSYENAVNILPKPEFIISLGALYAQTKNALALEVADALIIGNKAKAEKEAYFIKGLYYSFNNEQEKAITFFDKSISVSYTFMDAYMEKGMALLQLNKIEAAKDVFEKAVTIQNGYAEGYFQLGRCYEKLNRPTDALDAYNTAVIRDPSYIEAKEAMAKLGAK